MAVASIEAFREAAPAVLPSLLLCDFGDLKGEVSKLVDAVLEFCTWTSWTAISCPT